MVYPWLSRHLLDSQMNSVFKKGKIFGLNVVNVVRKRERQSELTEYLESIGGTYIYTEDMLRRPELTRDLWQQIPKPKLALNCVGGKATTDMVRLLDQNAVMVTALNSVVAFSFFVFFTGFLLGYLWWHVASTTYLQHGGFHF